MADREHAVDQAVLDGGRTVGAREASATEGVVGCGGGDGMRRCGPGEWRGRAGVDFYVETIFISNNKILHWLLLLSELWDILS